MTIGQRVRERRVAHGLSQENLAHAAGLSWGAIQRLEAGKIVDPHYSTLEGIAHTLGTTVAELVGEKEPVPLDKALDQGPSEAGSTWRGVQRILSMGVPMGRGPNVTQQMLAELGIDATDDEVTRRRIYTGLAAERAGLLESTAELWDKLLDLVEHDVDTLRQMEHVTIKEIINHAIDEEEIKERCAPEQRDQLERAEQRLLEADRRVSQAIEAKLPSREIDAWRAERQAKFQHLGIANLA
jgi:transcriptional regulator with XRE-family HTH domain